MNNLINTATLTKYIKEQGEISGTAIKLSNGTGYLLQILVNDKVHTLSTWRSNQPRVFIRENALLNEASKIGLSSVIFELASTSIAK